MFVYSCRIFVSDEAKIHNSFCSALLSAEKKHYISVYRQQQSQQNKKENTIVTDKNRESCVVQMMATSVKENPAVYCTSHTMSH